MQYSELRTRVTTFILVGAHGQLYGHTICCPQVE